MIVQIKQTQELRFLTTKNLMKIPILNIYFLLCYAWNRLNEGQVVSVGVKDQTSLLDLFARVLISGTNHLIKRGLDRGYVSESESIRGIKGKIDFDTSLKRQLLANGIVHCNFDDLSYNILHNQILKTTIKKLTYNNHIHNKHRDELKALDKNLRDIEVLRLQSSHFSRVQLHSNNSFYGFLINICEMIYHYYFISEETGVGKFKDHLRDKDMPKLFEDFVRNFYKTELIDVPGYQVIGSEHIRWDAAETDDTSKSYLPIMETDISIKTPDRYMIIDTKYYRNALQQSQFKETVRSNHLYQLFAYLKNIEKRGQSYQNCRGVLLYPTVEKDLEFEYEIQGHKIEVRTLDLRKDWKKISDDLLKLVGIDSEAFQSNRFQKLAA